MALLVGQQSVNHPTLEDMNLPHMGSWELVLAGMDTLPWLWVAIHRRAYGGVI